MRRGRPGPGPDSRAEVSAAQQHDVLAMYFVAVACGASFTAAGWMVGANSDGNGGAWWRAPPRLSVGYARFGARCCADEPNTVVTVVTTTATQAPPALNTPTQNDQTQAGAETDGQLILGSPCASAVSERTHVRALCVCVCVCDGMSRYLTPNGYWRACAPLCSTKACQLLATTKTLLCCSNIAYVVPRPASIGSHPQPSVPVRLNATCL